MDKQSDSRPQRPTKAAIYTGNISANGSCCFLNSSEWRPQLMQNPKLEMSKVGIEIMLTLMQMLLSVGIARAYYKFVRKNK